MHVSLALPSCALSNLVCLDVSQSTLQHSSSCLIGHHQLVWLQDEQVTTEQPEESLSVDPLPTSTHMSMTAGLSDSSPEPSHADIGQSSAEVAVPTEASAQEDAAMSDAETGHADSVGQASIMSDGSFISAGAAKEDADAPHADADAQTHAIGQASMMSDGSFVHLATDAMDSSSVAEPGLQDDGAALQAEQSDMEREAVEDEEAAAAAAAAALELSAETQEVCSLLEGCTSGLQQQEAAQGAVTAEAGNSSEDEQVSCPAFEPVAVTRALVLNRHALLLFVI